MDKILARAEGEVMFHRRTCWCSSSYPMFAGFENRYLPCTLISTCTSIHASKDYSCVLTISRIVENFHISCSLSMYGLVNVPTISGYISQLKSRTLGGWHARVTARIAIDNFICIDHMCRTLVVGFTGIVRQCSYKIMDCNCMTSFFRNVPIKYMLCAQSFHIQDRNQMGVTFIRFELSISKLEPREGL